MTGSGDDQTGPDRAGPDRAGPAQEGAGEVGSLAEEANRLLGALSGWARDQREDLGMGADTIAAQVSATLHDLDEHLATGSAECTVCPVCRTVSLMRGLSPEVKAHLASAAWSMTRAATALLETKVPAPGAAARTAPLEHVDVTDAPPAAETEQEPQQ